MKYSSKFGVYQRLERADGSKVLKTQGKHPSHPYHFDWEDPYHDRCIFGKLCICRPIRIFRFTVNIAPFITEVRPRSNESFRVFTNSPFRVFNQKLNRLVISGRLRGWKNAAILMGSSIKLCLVYNNHSWKRNEVSSANMTLFDRHGAEIKVSQVVTRCWGLIFSVCYGVDPNLLIFE